MHRSLLLALAVLATACKSDDKGDDPPADGISCADVDRANCVEIAAGDVDALQETVNTLEDDSAIVFGEGTFSFDDALTVRGADGVTIIGQGIDRTLLDLPGFQ